MKKRLVLGIVCYIISLGCLAFCGYFSYLTFNGTFSELQGFLTFILFWIGSYWFSTFYNQLTTVKGKDGKKKHLIAKTPRRLMGDAATVISVALIVFWGYLYLTRHTSLLSFLSDK